MKDAVCGVENNTVYAAHRVPMDESYIVCYCDESDCIVGEAVYDSEEQAEALCAQDVLYMEAADLEFRFDSYHEVWLCDKPGLQHVRLVYEGDFICLEGTTFAIADKVLRTYQEEVWPTWVYRKMCGTSPLHKRFA